MTVSVSTNYRRLDPDEVPIIAAECDAAWKNPSIPRRQWVGVVRGELQRYREGESMPHFEVLIRALRKTGLLNPTLLEIGASSGYYAEVLATAGFRCSYVALDYSEAYRQLAEELFPGIVFKIGDARNLPYLPNSFEICVSGNCLLHIFEAEKAIAEAARVASKFVIVNRSAVSSVEESHWIKEAYGVPVYERHFYEPDLLDMFARCGLEVVTAEDNYTDPENLYSQRTYLLEKLA